MKDIDIPKPNNQIVKIRKSIICSSEHPSIGNRVRSPIIDKLISNENKDFIKTSNNKIRSASLSIKAISMKAG